jgi:hypothetical protein
MVWARGGEYCPRRGESVLCICLAQQRHSVRTESPFAGPHETTFIHLLGSFLMLVGRSTSVSAPRPASYPSVSCDDCVCPITLDHSSTTEAGPDPLPLSHPLHPCLIAPPL